MINAKIVFGQFLGWPDLSKPEIVYVYRFAKVGMVI